MITIDEGYYIDRDALSMSKYGYKFDELTSGRKRNITVIMGGKLNGSSKKPKKKSSKQPKLRAGKYSGDGKKAARNMVLKNLTSYGAGLTLALESDELHCVNALPDHKFVIFEHNPLTYELLREKHPRNVLSLNFGDVSEAKEFPFPFEYAFLDFCNTYGKNKETLYSLRESLRTCKFIALTFSQRNWRGGRRTKDQVLADKQSEEFRDKRNYKLYLIKELQKIFRSHEYYDEYSYRDTTPMCSMVLKRRDLNV
jgi:hypothetical protein